MEHILAIEHQDMGRIAEDQWVALWLSTCGTQRCTH